ncbi:MAG TPA: TonB-dependent receptor [Steroidobacteraceae bacterium]|nr:TonB-dependent receptor [Steroidobacteraceae bacterium]
MIEPVTRSHAASVATSAARTVRKIGLKLALVACTSLCCAVAFAQQGEPPGASSPATQSASATQKPPASEGQSSALLADVQATPAPAQSTAQAPPENGELQEVVVTARYRQENLQQTPLSITAITAADIQQQALESVNDLGNEIPNAYFRQPVSNFGPTETIGLRGFTQTDFDYSFQPTVGVYVDDVYQGSLTGSSLDLADLSRVEVANGPQGTLFGVNSIGGAIRLITNKPQDNDSGSVQFTYGEKQRIEFVGIGNASLIPEKLFVRVVATEREEGAVGHYLDFTCEMKAQGQPASVYGTLPESISPEQGTGCAIGGLGGYDHKQIRGMLRYLPTSGMEINVNAFYYQQADQPPLQTLLTPYGGPYDLTDNCYSQGCTLGPFHLPGVVFPLYGMNYAGNCGGQSCNPHFVSPSPWDNYSTFGDIVTGQSYNPQQVLDEYGTSATLDYDITDSLHFKYIWAYRTYTTNWINDSDLTPFGLTQTNYLQGHRQFSNEARLTGDVFDKRLEYTVGFFSYDARELETSGTNFDADAYLGELPNFENIQGFTTNNEAGYLHLNFKLTDKWSVSAGARYTDQYLTETFTHISTVPADSIYLPGQVVRSGSRGDWSGSINYQLTPDIFLYTEAASGYTLPGFNARVETIGQLEENVPGQEAVNYEIGAKTEWFDHRLRVNGSVFYEDYKSYLNLALGTQCTPASSPSAGTPVFGLPPGAPCPAGTPLAGVPGYFPYFYYSGIPAYMPGAELEAYAEPIDRLVFNFTGGWEEFHSKISDVTNPDYINPSVRLQPEWDASGGVQYGIMLPNSATLTPRLDWRYQGYVTNGPEADYQIPEWRVPGYSLFNASLTYAPDGAKWKVAFQALNVFNKFYWVQLGAPTTLLPGATVPSSANLYETYAQVGTPGLPREWMATFTMNF